jgi:hypothetical protein
MAIEFSDEKVHTQPNDWEMCEMEHGNSTSFKNWLGSGFYFKKWLNDDYLCQMFQINHFGPGEKVPGYSQVAHHWTYCTGQTPFTM